MLNFKGLLSKLSIFRDNTALLLPIIIGAVAGLIFIPTQLLSGRLRSQIEDKSISMGKRLRSESDRAVPRDQWKEEEKRQQAYANDANQVSLLAKQSTQRELLSYKIFPDPCDLSALIFREFGQRYRSGIDQMLTRINARERPTDAELERGLQSSASRSPYGTRYPSMTAMSPSRTSSYGRFTHTFNEMDAAIVDEICLEKARAAPVYANPTDLSGYEFWGEYKYDVAKKEAVEDCWYYQLAYWVVEDVINTIGSMNSGSSSVLTSPVKRLLRVSFAGTQKAYRSYRRPGSSWGGAAAGTTDKDRPSYVLSPDQGLTEPCTGRYCNEDVDVIHFNVVVVVGAKSVLPFMKELCSGKNHKFRGFSGEEPERTFKHNQITVLESKILPVDRQDNDHSLYRYGDEAVVELDLICEYIFNKKSCEGIKPESVKTALGGQTQTTGK
jgi:hypothetical protein